MIALFSRNISGGEIIQRLNDLGVRLPVAFSLAENTEAQPLTGTDADMLDSVLKMGGRARCACVVTLEVGSVSMPLLSFFVFGRHTIAFVCDSDGNGIFETTSVADVQALMKRCLVVVPEPREVLPEAVWPGKAAELHAALAGDEQPELPVSEEMAELLRTAVKEKRSLHVHFGSAAGSAEGYVLDVGGKPCSLYDGEAGARFAEGSGAPVLNDMISRLIDVAQRSAAAQQGKQ